MKASRSSKRLFADIKYESEALNIRYFCSKKGLDFDNIDLRMTKVLFRYSFYYIFQRT